VESLAARVDFNERRVRGFEHIQQQPRPSAGRPPEAAVAPPPSSAPVSRDEPSPTEQTSSEASSPEGSRRRRRRRRGRRSGQLRDISGAPIPAVASAATLDQNSEGDDFEDDATADDLIDEVSASSAAAEEAPVEDVSQPPRSIEHALPTDSFEAASPSPDPFETPPVPGESLQAVSSPVEEPPPAPESSPASPLESVEPPESVPPDRS
jgi:hypothetical protein